MSFTLSAIATRELSDEFDTLAILFVRSIISIAVMVAVVWLSREGFKQLYTKCLHLHIARNSIHFVGQFSWFFALSVISLVEVFALEFTIPLWIAVLAPIFLREKLTWQKALYTVIGFMGILVVVRPFSMQVETGSIVMLIGAIGFACSIMFTRYLARTETPLCILFYMSICQFPISLALVLAFSDILLPTDWLSFFFLIVISVGGLTAHYCMAKALTIAEALTVAPMEYLRLPLIALVGAVFYGEMVEMAVVVGSLLILTGNYLNIRSSTTEPH